MAIHKIAEHTKSFLKSLGFSAVQFHHAHDHFNFAKPGRRILIIGPMGSGKTEFTSRIWRDAKVLLKKSSKVAEETTTGNIDRRKVFFIRSILDQNRFPDYPDDALAHRGGYERLGNSIAHISNSFQLENILENNSEAGTWIIDEATFYDERIAYVISHEAEKNNRNFIMPTLMLNFRRDMFNATARLLQEIATEIIPLTAYCEHPDCIIDSFYTYRYYKVDGLECPAFYFDPLIIIGGDTIKDDPTLPNYCTRCDKHHYLPGKDYTFLVLKPLAEKCSTGSSSDLIEELYNIKNDLGSSKLSQMMHEKYDNEDHAKVNLNSLKIPYIAEKALMYLFAEQNLVTEELLIEVVDRLSLNREYMKKNLEANRRSVNLDQKILWEMVPKQ